MLDSANWIFPKMTNYQWKQMIEQSGKRPPLGKSFVRFKDSHIHERDLTPNDDVIIVHATMFIQTKGFK